eukprot:s430_g11.t1
MLPAPSGLAGPAWCHATAWRSPWLGSTRTCQLFSKPCAAVSLVTCAATRSKRRWQTGKLVHLEHLLSQRRFDFLVERRGKALLLSAPQQPFQRLSLPSPTSLPGEVELSHAMGSEKLGIHCPPVAQRRDWPLFWQVESWESNGASCLEIRSARRPELSLSVAPSGALQVIAAESEDSVFVEVKAEGGCSGPQLGLLESRRDCGTGVSLSELEIKNFAKRGVLVLPQAVPSALWEPASALVHSYLGQPGAIIDGGFDCMGKLEGKILHHPQFPALLADPSSAAGGAAAQLLGRRRLTERELQRCQVALRFPELMLSGEVPGAKRLELDDLKWHTDGCRTRQCSRHPFSLLVGVALTDTLDDVLSGNLCVWPGSHVHLRREPALGCPAGICDPSALPAALAAQGAPLRNYEGLPPCDARVAAPGRATALKLRAGDAVAPRYVCSGVRVMVYFRLQLERPLVELQKEDESETCQEVFFDLPGLYQVLGERTLWSDFLSQDAAMSENQRPAGAVLQTAASRLSLVDPSEPGESLSIASLSRSMMIGKSLTSAASHLGDPESREQSFMTRNGSMLMTSASTTGGGRPSARRASLAVGKDGQPEDSRAQMERIAKLRMEQTDHEQQLKDEEDKRNQAKMAEILVKAWGVGGKRMSGIVSKVEKKDDKDKKKLHGRLGNKEAEREAQEEKKAKLETMTLDKKRQIDQAAAVLGCPVDLRNYIFKQIEKEIKQNANAAKEQDEEDALEDLESPDINASLFKDGPSPGTEEVSAVFEEVRLLAESIEKLLEPRWKDLHGGSYSARTPRKTPGGGTLPAIRQGA